MGIEFAPWNIILERQGNVNLKIAYFMRQHLFIKNGQSMKAISLEDLADNKLFTYSFYYMNWRKKLNLVNIHRWSWLIFITPSKIVTIFIIFKKICLQERDQAKINTFRLWIMNDFVENMTTSLLLNIFYKLRNRRLPPNCFAFFCRFIWDPTKRISFCLQ